MKRLVAVSDSHGFADHLRDAVRLALEKGKIDIFVHLGDGHADLEAVRPMLLAANPQVEIVAVRGNNDPGHCAPTEALIALGRHKILAAHGHTHHVKYGLDRLCYAARERDATLALYGHTHRFHLEEAFGVLLVCPGAICDASMQKAAFVDIRLAEDGHIAVKLVDWSGVLM